MKISWFKNDEGSTSLTVILGILLSVILLASSAQWYWTNSSSSDIQTVADISVLAAADVSAKSVMFIQVLDALLLSANLFGLFLHAVTIVAGLFAISGIPGVSAAAATFKTQVANFNKQFSMRRRQFAKEAHKLANAVSIATPYLAMVQAYYVGRENSSHLASFNDTEYIALAVPFPIKGSVELSGFPDNEQKVLEESTKAGEENRESAEEISRLEDEIEKAIDECFRLDIYKPAGTTRPHWDPLSVIDDFNRGWGEEKGREPPEVNGLDPLSSNSAHRDTLQQMYRQDFRKIADDFDSGIRSALNTAKSSRAANVLDLSSQTLLSSLRNTRIYVIEHSDGAKTAYHTNSNCFGLGNANQVNSHVMDFVIGDRDHTPCLICKPLHWQAISAWSDKLAEYVQSWNAEAAALRRWYLAKQKREEEQGKVETRTEDAFGTLLEEAKSIIRGGRLSYTPAGARGFICIVVSTDSRSLPTFTMPALTGSGDVELGRQVAMSGARMMPSKTDSTIPDLLSETHEQSKRGGGDDLSGLTLALLSDDNSSSADAGGVGAVMGFILRIWGSCLALYTKGTNELDKLIAGLPFGLDGIVSKAVKTFFETAYITAPDLRRPQPTLVNTADIGDVSAGGFEAGFVRSVDAAKKVLEVGQGLSATGMRENLSRILDELEVDAGRRIDEMLKIEILGVSIPLPFSETVQNLASQAFTMLRSKEDEILAALEG
ncbi:MAG: hypothetical protein FWD93_01555 [Coriobacteriia bacterium]|nr:hypothetical protein [Coriobacteriia bacterium]